jgi:hypothetical protein
MPRFQNGRFTGDADFTTMDHGDKDVAEALAKKRWRLLGEEAYGRFTREWS